MKKWLVIKFANVGVINMIKFKCKFCGHSSKRHVDDGGMCKSVSCFCLAQKRIIEKVESLNN